MRPAPDGVKRRVRCPSRCPLIAPTAPARNVTVRHGPTAGNALVVFSPRRRQGAKYGRVAAMRPRGMPLRSFCPSRLRGAPPSGTSRFVTVRHDWSTMAPCWRARGMIRRVSAFTFLKIRKASNSPTVQSMEHKRHIQHAINRSTRLSTACRGAAGSGCRLPGSRRSGMVRTGCGVRATVTTPRDPR